MRDTDETRVLGFMLYSSSMDPPCPHTPDSGRIEPITIKVQIHGGGVIENQSELVVEPGRGRCVVPLVS